MFLFWLHFCTVLINCNNTGTLNNIIDNCYVDIPLVAE